MSLNVREDSRVRGAALEEKGQERKQLGVLKSFPYSQLWVELVPSPPMTQAGRNCPLVLLIFYTKSS